jgi:hypothetical protein
MINFKTIVMTADQKGSADGVNVRLYRSGEQYDVPDSLASVFVDTIKCAVYFEEKQEQKPVVKKEPKSKPKQKTSIAKPVSDEMKQTRKPWEQ